MEEIAAPSMANGKQWTEKRKLERALMADLALAVFGRRRWYHHVRTAETKLVVVVARRETAAARRKWPAKSRQLGKR